MDFFLSIFILIVSFFILYLFSKHDFVLLRQNISLAQIFDSAIIVILVSFAFGRIFYFLNAGEFDILFSLGLIHFFNYPGFSILGFIIGAAVALGYIFRKKKGLGRINDIFTISTFPLFLFILVISSLKINNIYLPIVLIVIGIAVFAFFIKSHNKYILRDGSISYIYFFLVCLGSFFLQVFDKQKFELFFSFSSLQILSALLAIVSLGMLFLNQARKEK